MTEKNQGTNRDVQIAAKRQHQGVSLWRDRWDSGHWVLSLPGRWLFHFYAGSGRKQHFYLKRRPPYRHHLNEPYPEFRRFPL